MLLTTYWYPVQPYHAIHVKLSRTSSCIATGSIHDPCRNLFCNKLEFLFQFCRLNVYPIKPVSTCRPGLQQHIDRAVQTSPRKSQPALIDQQHMFKTVLGQIRGSPLHLLVVSRIPPVIASESARPVLRPQRLGMSPLCMAECS